MALTEEKDPVAAAEPARPASPVLLELEHGNTNTRDWSELPATSPSTTTTTSSSTSESASRSDTNDKPGPTYESVASRSATAAHDNGGGSYQQEKEAAAPQEPPKPGLVQRIMTKLGLDLGLLITMFRGSLPPIIAIAILQTDSVSALFKTLGYEIPIIAVLGMGILPRGKFIQTLTLHLLAICIGAAIGLLVLWSSIQARLHTSTPEEMQRAAQNPINPPYNSSQSAVCGVWLFANIWFVNIIRAKFPAFNLTSIIYSILVNITAAYGVRMISMVEAEQFIKQMITAMLLALGITTAVSLFVFPVSSRLIVKKQFAGAFMIMRKAVALQKEYLQGLEREDMFKLKTVETAIGRSAWDGEVEDGSDDEKPAKKRKKNGRPEDRLTKEEKAALKLKATITQLRDLSGKMHGEMKFAKRDAAWGKLSAHDLGVVFKLFRKIFIPIVGMSTIMDIFRRTAEHRGWHPGQDVSGPEFEEREPTREMWNDIMRQLHEPFGILSEAIDQGLEHAAIQLEFIPRPKVKQGDKATAGIEADVEARGGELKPGDQGFSKVIDEKVKRFYSCRGNILHHWACEQGLVNSDTKTADMNESTAQQYFASCKERKQAQLFVILYMEQLMHATGEAVQDMVDFAEEKVRDGAMSKKLLMLPTLRRMRKWVVSVFRDEDAAADESPAALDRAGSSNIVFVGDGFSRKRDPEHLLASNAWEKFGNVIRKVSRFLSSEQSMFGFRVACATMTIGITCFLEKTQQFFNEQRLVWAMIIIAMGMTQTAGQSIFGFLARVGGSFLAMCFSLVVWYIVDGHTAGIIVFLWLLVFIEYYAFIKFPRFIPAVMITIITEVLIIGYELQVRKIGVAMAERSGQKFYPVYELAPYRLATVAGGCLVAFFWTIFPSPLTDRTWIRRDLSAVLYLLANYVSVINETLKASLEGTAGNIDEEGTPAASLYRVRQKLFSKLMLLLPSLEVHSQWQKWEPTIGGKFPREVYDDIILRSNRILNYLTLMSYTATWSPRDSPEDADREWRQAVAEVMHKVSPANFTLVSTLTLLSNSLLSGQSLPPHIALPIPFEMTRHLLQTPTTTTTSTTAGGGGGGDGLDRRMTANSTLNNLLDPSNMEQRGYTAFAVLQVCSMLIADDLKGMIESVSSLVGVVDFTLRVDSNDSSYEEPLQAVASRKSKKGKGKGKAKGKGKRD